MILKLIVTGICAALMAIWFMTREEVWKDTGRGEKFQLFCMLYCLVPAMSYAVFTQETGAVSCNYPSFLTDDLVWWHVKEWGLPYYPYLVIGFCVIFVLFSLTRIFKGHFMDVLGTAGILGVEFFAVNLIVLARNFLGENILGGRFLASVVCGILIDGFFTVAVLLPAVLCVPFGVLMIFPSVGSSALHSASKIGRGPKKSGNEASSSPAGGETDLSRLPARLYSGTASYGRSKSFGYGVEYVNENNPSDRIVITNIYSRTGSEIDTNAGHFNC